jgi:hypothetical protein
MQALCMPCGALTVMPSNALYPPISIRLRNDRQLRQGFEDRSDIMILNLVFDRKKRQGAAISLRDGRRNLALRQFS